MRVITVVRSAVVWAGVLAVMLAVMLDGGTAEAAPVPRGPQHARSATTRSSVEPKSVRGRSAATSSKSVGSKSAGSNRIAAKAGTRSARAGGGTASAKARAGKTATRNAKDTLRDSRPRAQAKQRRGRKEEEVEPPVRMYRAKGKASDVEPKSTEHEIAAQRAEKDKALTVEDFEKAANGAGETASGDVAAGSTALKSEGGKPLTRSAVRAANEKAAEEKAAQDKVAAADKMALKPTGARLPMVDTSVKKMAVVRTPAPVVRAAAAAPVVKPVVLPTVQANGPRAAVVARATALPRLEATGDVSDPAPVTGVMQDASDLSGSVDSAAADVATKTDVFSQSVMTQGATLRETADATPAPAPLRGTMSLRAPTHEEMAEAVTQPVVLPGLYRDGRLVVPAPLKGTREILVHQNTMADAEGLERIRNESDLNRLRATHELVNLQESVSLRLNPELTANRRCARVWSVRFAEDMSRAFYARFHEPLQVNSAARTVAFQVRLQRVNGNAAGTGGEAASPHLTGQALDFGKRGMSVEEIAWMRGYLLPLMQAGKVDVEEEFQQACFHISVYKSYLPSAPTRRRMELATLHTSGRSARSVPPTEDDQQ